MKAYRRIFMHPAISIVIPVYNAEKYLEDCMDAILGQTFQDYEILCINDGSQDGSLNILHQYEEKYPAFIHVCSQENQGQAAARNVGVDKAIGEYIAFLDADDLIEKDYFEVLYTAAKEQDSEMVICSYEKFDNDGNIILRRNTKDWEVQFGNGLTHVFQYSPWGKLISREMLKKYNIRFISGEKMEDGPYGIITNSVARNVVCLDYIGYHYRAYPDSTMGGIREKGVSMSRMAQKFPLKGIEYAADKVREILGPEYDKVLEFCVLKAIAGFVFVFCKRKDKDTHKEICRFADHMLKDYFPNAGKNPYIKHKLKNLPYSHQMAVRLLVVTHRLHVLYPFARFYKNVFHRK